jgi:hypothetical protein
MTYLWRTCREPPENLSRTAQEFFKPLCPQRVLEMFSICYFYSVRNWCSFYEQFMEQSMIKKCLKCARKVLEMLLKSSQCILNEFLKCSPFVTFKVLGIGALFMNSLWYSPWLKSAWQVLYICSKSSRNILKEFSKCSPFVTLKCQALVLFLWTVSSLNRSWWKSAWQVLIMCSNSSWNVLHLLLLIKVLGIGALFRNSLWNSPWLKSAWNVLEKFPKCSWIFLQ